MLARNGEHGMVTAAKGRIDAARKLQLPLVQKLGAFHELSRPNRCRMKVLWQVSAPLVQPQGFGPIRVRARRKHSEALVERVKFETGRSFLAP